MGFKQYTRKKTLEILLAEMAGEHRLHRVLGPVALTALGIGAIIGAGIFVVTGRAASVDAGPAIIVSFSVAAIGCTLAALCYAEFASMAPVAGSAYTYAYATLGEIFAWIIGWDLMLEYAMSCATVASAWTKYLNAFLKSINIPGIPEYLSSDPFSHSGAWLNLPAVLIMLVVTAVLVRGIRESATTNAILVMVKLAVVLFVIGVGVFYINPANWTEVPVAERNMPEEVVIPEQAKEYLQENEKLSDEEFDKRARALSRQLVAVYRIEREQAEVDRLVSEGSLTPGDAKSRITETQKKYAADLPTTDAERAVAEQLLAKVREKAPGEETRRWGLIAIMGLDRWLVPIDNATRTPFAPYGFSGIMLGASIVFFAYIGFDSISTHAEEARRPQRDVPLAILSSLAICTVLYIAVAVVITGMVPYPTIDHSAPIAVAFADRAEQEGSKLLNGATALIAAGGLAGMTSVLLVTFLSQVRVFMAMARDGLLPRMFGEVHPRFKTPHLATMLTGGVICVVTAFTPILSLTEMVNIGTLMAFVVVCAAVLMLRVQRPDVTRPFRCPLVYFVAPLGIVFNLALMLFLAPVTWLRLAGWLGAGMLIYVFYGHMHSKMGHATLDQLQRQGLSPTDAPLPPKS